MLSRTAHEQGADAALDRILEHDGATAVFNKTVRSFRSGNFDERYVAWIGQTRQDPGDWSMRQVAAYLEVHTALNTGEYAMVTIRTGGHPGADRDRKGNAAKLSRMARPFRAHLDMRQSGADSDGLFSWDAPIRLMRSTGLGLADHGETTSVDVPWSLDPSNVPLEVGSTMPSRTLMHLKVEGGVAHWAYGDDCISLIVNRDRIF